MRNLEAHAALSVHLWCSYLAIYANTNVWSGSIGSR